MANIWFRLLFMCFLFIWEVRFLAGFLRLFFDPFPPAVDGFTGTHHSRSPGLGLTPKTRYARRFLVEFLTVS
jgi:hypothetical protein